MVSAMRRGPVHGSGRLFLARCRTQPIRSCFEIRRVPTPPEFSQESRYRLALWWRKQGGLAAISHTGLDRLGYHVSRLNVLQRREHERGQPITKRGVSEEGQRGRVTAQITNSMAAPCRAAKVVDDSLILLGCRNFTECVTRSRSCREGSLNHGGDAVARHNGGRSLAGNATGRGTSDKSQTYLPTRAGPEQGPVMWPRRPPW